jgi:hypothetical protein
VGENLEAYAEGTVEAGIGLRGRLLQRDRDFPICNTVRRTLLLMTINPIGTRTKPYEMAWNRSLWRSLKARWSLMECEEICHFRTKQQGLKQPVARAGSIDRSN